MHFLPLDFIKRRFTGLSLERPLLQREQGRGGEGKGHQCTGCPPPPDTHIACTQLHQKPHMCRLTWTRACVRCMHFFCVCVCVSSTRPRQVCEGCSPCGGGPSRASPRRSKMKGMRSSDEELRERGEGQGARSLGISVDICRSAVDFSQRNDLIYDDVQSANASLPEGHLPPPPKAGGWWTAFTARHLLLTLFTRKRINGMIEGDWSREPPRSRKSDNFHDLSPTSRAFPLTIQLNHYISEK